MPKKPSQSNEELDKENIDQIPNSHQNNDEIDNLTRMLASVLDYLSDEDNEEIDIGYIFDNTKGLREWWSRYQESNRKLIEEEIRESLSKLSLEQLNKIREQINK